MMARLTEEMVIARSKQSDLSAIKKLNCWGAELGDVTLLRRMPNVEVLALSINKIRTLDSFVGCGRLRELYVRKNEIRDLHEIRHLRRLPHLTSLWLDENPCTEQPHYRMTVLRNLPRLEKLDNVPVHPDEVEEAMHRGHHIPDSDDEGYPQQQEQYSEWRQPRSHSCSPEREIDFCRREQRSDSTEIQPETSVEAHGDVTQSPSPPPPARRPPAPAPACPPSPPSPPREHRGAAGGREDAMTRSHYDQRAARSPEPAALRHSISAQSVKEYSYGNGVTSPPHYHDAYTERGHDRCESYQQLPRGDWEPSRDRDRDRDRDSARDWDEARGGGAGGGAGGGRAAGRESAVMGEHRGFTRRPVTRNSNLLSALLCLVKELDYPSLEVAEMAVRCRMDELANSQ